MITEDYVSFETAKLLKEKGFDSDINLWYDEDGVKFFTNKYEISSDWRVRQNQNVYLCPTLQTAMKWLREVHKLSIEPYYSEVLTWVVDIKHIGKYTSLSEFEAVRDKNYDSYEQTCEAGIKYCLENLI